MSGAYFIGIDGGGTKTYGIIADENGKMLASTKRDSSNYLQVGIEKAQENLIGIIQELCDSQKIDLLTLDFCIIGLAGAGRPDDRETISKALVSGGLRYPQFEVTPDFTTALAGGTYGEPGVIIISGTGSVVFGIDENGNQKRAGGWGTLLADEGSGYDFGRKACRAVMRAYDGRSPATQLTDKILNALKLDSPEKLVKWSLNEGAQKNNVAALSPYVFEAFNEGDPVAEKIVTKAVNSMVELIKSVARGIDMIEKPCKVVLAGGNFAHQPKFVDLLRAKVSQIAPYATVDLPQFEPIVGAVILSLRKQEITITPEIIANIEATWPAMNL